MPSPQTPSLGSELQNILDGANFSSGNIVDALNGLGVELTQCLLQRTIRPIEQSEINFLLTVLEKFADNIGGDKTRYRHAVQALRTIIEILEGLTSREPALQALAPKVMALKTRGFIKTLLTP